MGRGSKRASARSTPPASAAGPRIRWPCGCGFTAAFYNLSDPAMEDALYDSVAVQRFVGLTARDPRPDETTILNFRLLGTAPAGRGACWPRSPSSWRRRACGAGRHDRGRDILDAPASTKNRAQARDDAPGEEGQPVVLRDEGAYRGRRGHGTGAQPGDDGGQRGGYHASAAAPAWGRDACGATPAMRAWPGAPSTRGGGSTGRWPCARGMAPGSAAAQAEQRKASIERRWSIHFSM